MYGNHVPFKIVSCFFFHVLSSRTEREFRRSFRIVWVFLWCCLLGNEQELETCKKSERGADEKTMEGVRRGG